MESTTDLAVQIRQLSARLTQIEATLQRVEQLLIGLQATWHNGESQTLNEMPRPVRFVSPRLRHRVQAADFVMTVTRDS